MQDEKASQPDCIITDVHMPGGSGLDLLVAVQRTVAPPPVILMTGLPGPEILERALRDGAVCVLSKPFDVRELLDRLLVAIPEHIQE